MSKKEEFYQKCLILDTETNSDDYAVAEIVELGFVIRENQNWSIFQELHKPANKIPPKVESICYITNKMVENCPSFSESREVFQDIVNNYRGGFFVGHNQFFDQRVLENHGVDFSNCEWICTWRMAKKLLSEVDGITETNLPYLRFALELDVPIDMLCHRAGNDSYITAKLLEIFVDILEESGVLDKNLPYGPQIVQWTQRPIIYEKMPFGKYKGELMSNIPQSYWQWAAKNTQWFDDSADNYDPDLAASINRVLV